MCRARPGGNRFLLELRPRPIVPNDSSARLLSVHDAGTNGRSIRPGPELGHQTIDGSGWNEGVAVEQQQQLAAGRADADIVRAREADVADRFDEPYTRPAFPHALDAAVR